MKNNPARQPDGMPHIKVSVLVPVYNGERFLPECLDSILAQDCASMEILIADDNSTDGSVAVLETYAARDPRIRWWKNPNNLGLAQNFNCCLRAAKGEYIKYVLQDDKLISPLAIRRMVEVLDNYPEVSLVGSASQIVDEHSLVTEVRDYFKPGIMDGRQMVVRCLEQPGNLIGEPSVVMFCRALAQLGFDEQLPQLLDLDMWFQLLEQGQFAYVAEPLCAFRKHAAQQTRVNLVSGAAANDDVILLSRWLARPWLEKMMTRRMNFALAYTLRRRHNASARTMSIELQRRMGFGWYAVFLPRWKISRPFEKLKRKLKLKIWRLSHQKAAPGQLDIGFKSARNCGLAWQLFMEVMDAKTGEH
jgi:glycosyltransferase involved in cell wall biosynthesis